MNSNAIRRLRKKFIAASVLTYFLVMFFMGLCINLLNSLSTRRQIDNVLDYIIKNEGFILDTDGDTNPSAKDPADAASNLFDDFGDIGLIGGDVDDFSSEFRYSTRFFTAVFDPEGHLISLNTENIAETSDNRAQELAAFVSERKLSDGRVGYYYFKRGKLSSGNTIYAFVNCQTHIRTNFRLIIITILIGSIGLLITYVIVTIFSYRFIKPEIENASRQKQFITNASHELKTPLAVIRANTEIQEMMNGENEWTQSTMRQVDRLNGLIANLVMITRAQEKEDRSVMTEIDVSKGVEETVRPYESLAQQDKKELTLDITPNIRIVADESKIRQLASLLIDNAFKYCDPEGAVTVQLNAVRKGKFIRLVISNSYAAGEKLDYSRFFERFYREDRSRNVDRGGYGIGLSIAESIIQQYGGSISASWKDGMISFTCLIPA